MKNLPTITVLLWVASLLGYRFLPEIFRQDLPQFILVIIFSILLPVSFWQAANSEKGKYLALLIVAIFIINTVILSLAVQSTYTAQQALADGLNRGIQPNFAEYLKTAADGKRKVAARIIYQKHGVALPYRNDTESYTLFVPSESDRKKYQENFFAESDLKIRNIELTASMITAVLLLLIHLGLFITLLVFLVLYDRREVAVQPG